MSGERPPRSGRVPASVRRELAGAFGEGADDADDAKPSSKPSSKGSGRGSGRRTIVIADEGLPEAEYLDEPVAPRRGGASSAGRATIVIEDLDDHGVTEQPPARSAGGIDPRMRARRRAVNKEEGRRRLMIAGLVLGAVAVVVLVIAAFASPLFDVRTVDVQGVVYADPDVVAAVVEDLEGTPVLLVDTRAAEERLESIPWVERARVRTDFPHTVYIDVRERLPIAWFQGPDGRFRVIDVEGRVLEVLDGQPVEYLPITGSHLDTARGAFAGPAYAAAANLVVSLPTEVRAVTEAVGVNPSTGGLTMTLTGPVQVRLGDLRNVDDKLARLLGRIRAGLTGVCELDVSTDEIGAVACPS